MLRSNKCYWYLIYYKWNKVIWKYSNGSPSEVSIHENGKGMKVILYTRIDEAREVVGVNISLAGDNISQFDSTKEKVEGIAKKFK